MSREEFAKSMNKILEAKFAEDENQKKRVHVEINTETWNVPKSNSVQLSRLSKVDMIQVMQFLDVYSLF